MGLVLNKPLDIDFAAVCEQLDIARHQGINTTMLKGGPVGTEQGFILHQQPGQWQATEAISEFAHLTSSKDILTAIGLGVGPENYRLTLG
ncbi:YqgE/AlgH family protein, partial [Gilvimarinus sp. 1_MG-2023]